MRDVTVFNTHPRPVGKGTPVKSDASFVESVGLFAHKKKNNLNINNQIDIK